MRIRRLLKTLREGNMPHGLGAVQGWNKRGSPTFLGIRGIMVHHTASHKDAGPCPATGTLVFGRSDLPGPLCHIQVCRQGKVKVIANGKANHAGEGGPWWKVWENRGNYYMVGIEAENNGIGEPWPPEQIDAIIAVCAALLRRRWPRLVRRKPWKAAKRVIGHKEWTSRKIDPTFDMDKFRSNLTRHLKKGDRRR